MPTLSLFQLQEKNKFKFSFGIVGQLFFVGISVKHLRQTIVVVGRKIEKLINEILPKEIKTNQNDQTWLQVFNYSSFVTMVRVNIFFEVIIMYQHTIVFEIIRI